jgi:arylsulfatase A-like enzyme
MHGAAVHEGQVFESASIMDIAPTIYYLLRCPIPTDLDGVVLADWLTPEVQKGRHVIHAAPVAPSEEHFALSTADQDELLQRLRDLGYVE